MTCCCLAAASPILKLQLESMVVATLPRGEFFGENALLRPDQKRNATITANGDLMCYTLSKEQFDQLGLKDRVQFCSAA